MSASCAVDACRRSHHARGYCYRHYFRLWSSGDARPEDAVIVRGNDLVRWSRKALIGSQGMCWEWQEDLDRDGYSRFKYVGKTSGRGHCFAYEFFVGAVPEGMQLDHLCRNRACVNPHHLEAVSARENMMRGYGPAAVNAKKDHCIRGHPFDDANTYRDKRGTRKCRACHRERQRRRVERERREEVPACQSQL